MRVWLLGLCSIACAASARADTLKVGAGADYATPCEAVMAARPADVIEIASGTYHDSCAIEVAGVTLRGVGARPTIDLSATDHPAEYKAIYVIAAADVTVDNLELTGAHISDQNGANAAGLRVEASGLTVERCFIHDNQNGILGGTTGSLTIEHSEFANNGLGDGCNQGGCTHNVYVANIDRLNFRFNWSHRIATDTNDKGHLLKSRAKQNYILYNRLSGEDGFDSYEIDLPNGGLAIVVGNLIEKGPRSGNGTMLSWGEEGASNPDARAFLVSNTFVDDFGSGQFVSAAGATLSVHDNIFASAGHITAPAGSTDDWIGTDPSFVDAAHYDFHLRADSPAIGKAIDPGSADQFSLTPVSEYVQPVGEVARASAHDCGAFEYANATATSAGSGGQDGAIAAGSGGDSAAGSGGNSAAGSGGNSAADNRGNSAADSGGMSGLGSTTAGAVADAGTARGGDGLGADGGELPSGGPGGCHCAIGQPTSPSRPSGWVGVSLVGLWRLRRRSSGWPDKTETS